MAVSAADVKRLREETDAPMMECQSALKEADGDFEKARQILREKGKAAASKRAGRATSEGVAMAVAAPDHKSAGGVILECETDFVAKNPDFVKVAEEVAAAFVATDPGADPLAVQANGRPVKAIVEETIAKFRENTELKGAVRMTGDAVAVYVHHDKKHAAMVALTGTASNVLEVGRKLAIQCVALKPKFVRKSDISQDVIDREIETQTQRAINEGKDPNIAKNIAQGRVNKEFYKSEVLLEQDFFEDLAKTVGAYVDEAAKAGGGTIEVKSFHRLSVGEG